MGFMAWSPIIWSAGGGRQRQPGGAFANPPQAPFQAYSWFVLPDLTVQSFADMAGIAHVPTDPA
jgi:hypothetical protein